MRLRSVWRCALTASVFSSFLLVGRSLPAGTIWHYDFGEGTGVFSSASSESTSFLPTPPTDGGSARVRVGSGGGQFALVNPGSGSSALVGTASSSTSVNKFSIYDFAGTGLFTLEAEVTFSGGDTGSWYLLAGNGDRFNGNSSFSTNQVFAGLRWDFGSGGELTTTRLSASGSWLTTGVPTMTQGTNYELKIHANNTPAAVEHAGLTVAPGTWDVYIDGMLMASGLAKAGLADDTPITAFMFNGAGSVGNLATLTVNSVSYANVLAPEPQAWVLLLIGAGCCGVVQWRCGRFRRRKPYSGRGNWSTTVPGGLLQASQAHEHPRADSCV